MGEVARDRVGCDDGGGLEFVEDALEVAGDELVGEGVGFGVGERRQGVGVRLGALVEEHVEVARLAVVL